MPKLNDLTGRKLGRWTVNSYAGKSASVKSLWWCTCDCGTVKKVFAEVLLRSSNPSCGCVKREQSRARLTTHGQSKHPLWNIWNNMMRRCYDNRIPKYKYYGGRGIKVCTRWNTDFMSFVADVTPRPSPKHTIDRIDNDGDYSPENTRWSTQKTQNRNSRRNVFATINGETKLVADWCVIYNTLQSRVCSRVARGWALNDAITKPPQTKYTNKSFLVDRGNDIN